MTKPTKPKKNDSFYGGDAYAEIGDSTHAKTFGQRLSVQEAINLRNALTLAIARCEIGDKEPTLPQFNMIILTTHKERGQITTLAKERRKPFKTRTRKRK